MSKKLAAESIYTQLIKKGHNPVKDKELFISEFITEAKLTPAGANTYLRNCRVTYDESTGLFGKLSASVTPSHSASQHTAVTSPTSVKSKANSGENTDERQLYSLVFKGENDDVASMECSTDQERLITLQKKSKKECIVIKGIGKDDADEIVYSKLKSVA